MQILEIIMDFKFNNIFLSCFGLMLGLLSSITLAQEHATAHTKDDNSPEIRITNANCKLVNDQLIMNKTTDKCPHFNYAIYNLKAGYNNTIVLDAENENPPFGCEYNLWNSSNIKIYFD